MDVQVKDFKVFNRWEPDWDGPKWGDRSPKYLLDMSTGRCYWNESVPCVAFKCFLLSVGTPFIHGIWSICNVACRALKLLSFYPLWEEGNRSFKERMTRMGAELFWLVAAPLALVGLELAALYGIFNPYDGRKLYASLERARANYGDLFLAPCFQPDPEYHAFGGDPETRDAF